MKNAILRTTLVSIECPHCQKFQASNARGSSDYEGCELSGVYAMTCDGCGKNFKLPKTIQLA